MAIMKSAPANHRDIIPTPGRGAGAVSGRDASRSELARLIEREPADLIDHARLKDDLHLDSLAMLTVLAWLESIGVTVDTQHAHLGTVGDVLSLLDNRTFPGLTIRVTDPLDRQSFNVIGPPGPAIEPADPMAPVMSNGAFRLDPVQPDDIGFLYQLAAQSETSFRWRYRGAPPAFDRFVNDLWQQVMVQFVVRGTAKNAPAGHVVVYGADPSLHHAYLGAAFLPAHVGSGLAAQIVALAVRYLFHTFPLRKVYLEVPGFNYDQIRSGEGRLFTVEGRLRDHAFYAGQYWDQYLCAIYPPAVAEQR
jgi:RimJ/RimL family protein N-acetyltransferase